MYAAANALRVPGQHPPITRGNLGGEGRQIDFGMEAAQTHCDNLRGLAQQMCYAYQYGS